MQTDSPRCACPPHLFRSFLWRPGAGPAILLHHRPKRAREGRARTVRARRRPGPAAKHAQVGRDRRKLRQRGVEGRGHHRPPLRPAQHGHMRQCTQAQRSVCWLGAPCHTAQPEQSNGCGVRTKLARGCPVHSRSHGVRSRGSPAAVGGACLCSVVSAAHGPRLGTLCRGGHSRVSARANLGRTDRHFARITQFGGLSLLPHSTAPSPVQTYARVHGNPGTRASSQAPGAGPAPVEATPPATQHPDQLR